jgi:hypothetical protein
LLSLLPLIHISLVSPCLVILWQTFFFGFAAKQPSGWFLTWEKERRVRMLVASVQKKVFFWFGGQTKKKLFFTRHVEKKKLLGTLDAGRNVGSLVECLDVSMQSTSLPSGIWSIFCAMKCFSGVRVAIFCLRGLSCPVTSFLPMYHFETIPTLVTPPPVQLLGVL